MEHLFYYYLIVINVLAFALMGIDKSKAKRHLWRIPEKTLFLSALLGGGAGAIIGMYFFHQTPPLVLCDRHANDLNRRSCYLFVFYPLNRLKKAVVSIIIITKNT